MTTEGQDELEAWRGYARAALTGLLANPHFFNEDQITKVCDRVDQYADEMMKIDNGMRDGIEEAEEDSKLADSPRSEG